MASNSTISESLNIFDFVVREGNGVKGLTDLGLNNIPKQYTLPVEERFDTSKAVSNESIPIIDVSNWDDPEVSEAIFNAARKWGFFQIINHGVPMNILKDLELSVRRFFDLPSKERKKYLKGNSPSDAVAFGTSFSPQTEKVLEWKDYLTMLYESDEQASQFWPPACKEEGKQYMKGVEVVIKRLIEVLLKKLNVKEIDKEKEHMLIGAIRLNFNYYPSCPNPGLALASRII